MKKIIALLLVVSFILAGCSQSIPKDSAASITELQQRFIARYKDHISIGLTSDDSISIAQEQEKCFDYFDVDIKSGKMNYQYTSRADRQGVFYAPLKPNRELIVRQLGNSEENNQLIVVEKEEKVIATNIACSVQPLVSISPSHRYIVYCAVEAIPNSYGLYMYDLQKQKTVQLIGVVNEALLNDMEWNISWSLSEQYVIASNKLIFDTTSGQTVGEINAVSTIWSPSGKKLCYVKPHNELGKTLCIYDLENKTSEELFIVNQDEFIPGLVVWNKNETKLAFATAQLTSGEVYLNNYKAVYSLDLTNKQAFRVDTALGLSEGAIAGIQSIHYNASGSMIAMTTNHYSESDLYLYNLETEASMFFTNVEYLHHENNEAYICTLGECFYLIHDSRVIELDKKMNSREIYASEKYLEDIYISKEGDSMIVIESDDKGTVLRQIKNFTEVLK